MGFDFESLTEATSGAVGGLLSTTILYPLDTCKTKYQAEVREGDLRKYRSLLDVLKEAIASNQVVSLYQGLGTKNLQSIISQFIYFYSYSYFKQLYIRKSKNKYMGTGANLIVAAAAGACTVIITQPLDTASAKMQTSNFGKSKSLWDTLSIGSWKEAFDGLGVSLILTSNPAIQYTVFEQLKRYLIQIQNQKKRRIEPAAEFSPVLSAFSAFLLGAFSKTIATIITYPAIRCKVMLQAADDVYECNGDDCKKVEGAAQHERPSKKMVQAFRTIWQKEGPSGFYKGLQAQIMKTVLSAALMLMIKEKVSQSTWVVMLALRSRTKKLKPLVAVM